MTVFESWVKTTVAALVRDMREETRRYDTAVADENRQHNDAWDALEHRLAIGLVQARALECRQIAGSVMIKQPADIQTLSRGLLARSSQLEVLGKEMATSWPFSEESVAPDAPGPRLVQ